MKLNYPGSGDVAPCYSELIGPLRMRGLHPYMNDRLTLRVAPQHPAMPDDGNCFFVLRLDEWFLTTMGGWTYRIPGTKPPIDLCLDLLDSKKVLGDVPEDIKTRYTLSLLDVAQQELLDARIHHAESLLPPDVDFESFVSEINTRNMNVERSATVPVCAVAGSVAGSRLWFILHGNHWYVKTAGGTVYSCWDEQVVGLCIYALKNEPAVLDRFPDNFIRGYYMRELSESEKMAVLEG